MDAEVDHTLLSNGQNLSQGCGLESLNLDSMDKLTNEFLEMSPKTPDSKQEMMENADDSQSQTSCIQGALNLGSNGSSPRTPKDNIFDPFAPGPDHLLLAPLRKKYDEDTRMNVSRMLRFKQPYGFHLFRDLDINAETMSEEDLLESLYRMLLRVVMASLREEVLERISDPMAASDGEKTPTSAPVLTGVAESCPGAPKKAARKATGFDKGLCKKLEF